ncbi:MAG: hypothetical protein IPM39_19700 [Chloroflexi bacterium]|nr:hypothetical protein [Chloroflexota bacterium]
MLNPDSRYYHLEEAIYEAPNGRKIVYKRRRFLPQGEPIPELQQVTLAPDDRLDLIAARALGDPLAFWQIADANNALNPADLTGAAQIGRNLKIPIPQFKEAT